MFTSVIVALAAASGAFALAGHSGSSHAALAKRLAEPEVHTNLTKRTTFSGRTTWYPTDTGPDACTGKNHKDSDWFIAMNMPQSGSCCGKQVNISYKGKSTVASCVDYCASCPEVGQIDLTKDLFLFFTGDLGIGEFTSEWYFTDGDSSGDSSGDDSDDDKPTTKAAPKTTKKTTTAHKTTTTTHTTSTHHSSSTHTSSHSSSSKSTATSTSTSDTPAPTDDSGVANVGGGAADDSNSTGIAGALAGSSGSSAGVLVSSNIFAAAGAVIALLAVQAL